MAASEVDQSAHPLLTQLGAADSTISGLEGAITGTTGASAATEGPAVDTRGAAALHDSIVDDIRGGPAGGAIALRGGDAALLVSNTTFSNVTGSDVVLDADASGTAAAGGDTPVYSDDLDVAIRGPDGATLPPQPLAAAPPGRFLAPGDEWLSLTQSVRILWSSIPGPTSSSRIAAGRFGRSLHGAGTLRSVLPCLQPAGGDAMHAEMAAPVGACDSRAARRTPRRHSTRARPRCSASRRQPFPALRAALFRASASRWRPCASRLCWAERPAQRRRLVVVWLRVAMRCRALASGYLVAAVPVRHIRKRLSSYVSGFRVTSGSLVLVEMDSALACVARCGGEALLGAV